jgi:hypothetical protein
MVVEIWWIPRRAFPKRRQAEEVGGEEQPR